MERKTIRYGRWDVFHPDELLTYGGEFGDVWAALGRDLTLCKKGEEGIEGYDPVEIYSFMLLAMRALTKGNERKAIVHLMYPDFDKLGTSCEETYNLLVSKGIRWSDLNE